MDWITCPSCDEEFKIITDSTTTPVYCPFCSEELDIEDLYDEDDDE
jgi:ribosomal protein S27E